MVALGCLRQLFDELQRLAEMDYRFRVGRVFHGTLPGAAPIGDASVDLASLRIVVGDNLRFGLDNVWKLLFQHLCDALVQLLALAPEERLVRCFLDQRMLEDVPRVGPAAPAEHQLGFNQLVEGAV